MFATETKLGLVDHGHPVTLEQFDSAEFEEGFKYEIIDGRLYVSPMPNLPEDQNVAWLYEKLVAYKLKHPRAIRYLSQKARVFVPGREELTIPEPDISIYRVFASDPSPHERKWQNFSPILVIEVLYDADPHKDLVRNVELYLQVPSIREYWILDARDFPDEPTLIVHRRRGQRWVRTKYRYGETYTTKILPGFKLLIDPQR
jgi:Uma2 family endonuclease